MNLFEFSLKWKGFPIEAAKTRLKEIQTIPENLYPNYVEEQRMNIVNYHLKHNSFYREFTNSTPIATWNDVPVMQKSHLQRPLSERLSEGYTERTVYVNKTSGSSGHPFIFAKDKFCHALTWAHVQDLYKRFGIELGTSLEARFYGIPLDWAGYQKEKLKDILSKRVRFPIFDLSDKKMEAFLEKFSRLNFDLINGYTSSIVLFAKFLQSKNLILSNICPSLKLCIVTSEMLFESDKSLLENTLGVPVYNEYGASELGIIGFANTKGEMSLNSENLFIEILNDHNRPVPFGESGKIVITDLFNKAHPMIRYEIGDSGAFDTNYSLKNPVLTTLLGRTNDIAELPNNKKVPGLTFYYVTKSVIEETSNVKEFIVEQTAVNTFLIIYVSEMPLSDNECSKIQKALDVYVGTNLSIELKRVKILDRTNRGKLKQFIKRF